VREPTRRAIFVGVAAIVSGLGIWATHFIAMLAYEPGLSVSYDVPTTALSVLAAIVFSGLGWTVALDERPVIASLGGAIIGGGVAVMHYIGMSAVRLAGEIVWERDLVIASVVMGVGFAMTAIWFHRRRPRAPAFAAATLLTLAICSTHFTGMAAAVIYPHATSGIAVESVDSPTLAIILTIAVTLILTAAGGMIQFDRRLTSSRLTLAQQRSALAEEICAARRSVTD